MIKRIIALSILGIALGVILSAICIICSKPTQPERNITIEELTTESEEELTTVEVPTDYNPALDPRYQTTEILTETETEESIIEETTTVAPTEPVLGTMWTISELNFRIGPSKDFEIYYVLPRGAELTVINFDWDNEWTQILYQDDIGYVYTSYLSEDYIHPYDYYYMYEGGQIEELDFALQEYIQDILTEWGCRDFYKIFLCQAYQESRYNMNSIGRAHGGYNDYGIMQIWEGHAVDPHSHAYHIIQQHPNYKTNPYDNIYIGLWIWHEWYKATGDYITALGCYLSGTIVPDQYYISCVLYHLDFLHKEE